MTTHKSLTNRLKHLKKERVIYINGMRCCIPGMEREGFCGTEEIVLLENEIFNCFFQEFKKVSAKIRDIEFLEQL